MRSRGVVHAAKSLRWSASQHMLYIHGPRQTIWSGGGLIFGEKNVLGVGDKENFSLFTPSKHPKTLFNWVEKFL